MAQSNTGKANRFYSNPVLRDAEWNRAKQAPLALVLIVLACVIVGFFAGVYADKPYSVAGWLAGTLAIVVYIAVSRIRRGQARRTLRQAHAQMAS